ncbi:hypothetical protein [Candidatus Palauibacter sp.]|uniref:hypothetical protein n=1 Tax=Candidatus Palauibacter sp. TaxID=3101350 RepID=UPI003B51A80F
MAVGTIPAHTVDIGGTAAVPAAGYFSDPDGDALTYSASSSSDAVATVNIEGSTATVTGVARGSAVVTITAADPDGLQANQGFNVEVGQDAIKEATVTIFGLRAVSNRDSLVAATDVKGTISVLLDVQSNDETVTAVALTLDDAVISCRGTSSDQAAGLADSGGGQIEIECLLPTAKKQGTCEGYPLEPMYMNGDRVLGARITTAEGATRETLATQTITLKNSNYIDLAFSPGKAFVFNTGTTAGNVTWYGGPGPAAPDNQNSFHACPVIFDEDIVVGRLTGGGSAQGRSSVDLSFLAPSATNPISTQARPVARSAPPYTWDINPDWNRYVEGLPAFVINGVLDPDGNDIRDKFASGNLPSANLPRSPEHLQGIGIDFKPPLPDEIRDRLSGRNTTPSKIHVGRWDRRDQSYDDEEIEEGMHYSDTFAGVSQRLVVTEMWELGSSSTADFVPNNSANHIGLVATIAVGDCSVPANKDTGRTGTATPFVPIVENATGIADLPEDDASTDGVDRHGVACYVAELQSMTDRMGNDARPFLEAWGIRVQSSAAFGVDRRAPEISDEQPDKAVILRNDSETPISLPTLTFSTSDPKLESGDPGSGVVEDSIRVYTGAWLPTSRRTWGGYLTASNSDRSGLTPATYGEMNATGDVTIYLDSLAVHRRHTVNVAVPDNASPPNWATTSFTVTIDNTAPSWMVGNGTSAGMVNARGAASAVLRVVGTISDANEIESAVLTVRSGGGGSCETNLTALPDRGTTKRVNANGFDLANGSNKIEIDEVVTITRPSAGGGEQLCVTIETEDAAVDSSGRGAGNEAVLYVADVLFEWGS